MSEIVKLYDKVDLLISANPSIEKQLSLELSRLISAAYTSMMGSDEGYCYKFSLPATSVLKLFDLLQLNIQEVGAAFRKDWGLPITAIMWNDPYYHILLLIVYYGIRSNKLYLQKNAFLIVSFKIWNGRKAKFLRYCDKRVMNYVITHMVNNKHLVTKFDSPLSLCRDHFVETLLKKYVPEIKKSPFKLKRLFEQIFARIRQLWVQSKSVDIKTGEKTSKSGLMILFKRAKDEGLYLSNPRPRGSDDGDPEFSEFSTVSNREEIARDVSDFIVLNPNPNYNRSTVLSINKETKVAIAVVEKILTSIHDHNLYSLIYDIISLILRRTNTSEKSDICKPNYFAAIKKNVISSKNNVDVRKIQSQINQLLTNAGINYAKYSNVQQIQIRNVVIYGLYNNLKKSICQIGSASAVFGR